MFRSFFRSQQLLGCSTHSPIHHRVHSSTPLVHAMSHINQSTLFNPTPIRSILIVSSHLHLGFQSCLSPQLFPTKSLYMSPVRATCPLYLILSWITLTVFQSTPHHSSPPPNSTPTPSPPIPVHLNCITVALPAALRTRFITQFASL
jgi:hypothetical protein